MKNIKSVQTLMPEQWQAVADGLLCVAPAVQTAFRQSVKDHPELIGTDFDPDVFEANVRAAVTAIFYVVAFGTDKCKFAIVDQIDAVDNMSAEELREVIRASNNRT